MSLQWTDGDDITPLFILDNKMMMFLDQNCLSFHVIAVVSNDIDYMVFKKLFKDCIDICCIVGHITCYYDSNTTYSPYA